MMRICDYKDEYGLEIKKDVPYVDSRYVAEMFNKEHKNVLQDIRNLLSVKDGLTEEFSRLNFQPSKYTNQRGKTYPCYKLTKDGFTMLVMGYNTDKALKFKEMYIKRFNEMESFISTLQLARADFPTLTDNLKLAYGDDAKPYTYSNECNMINKIVLGMSTQKFKKDNNIQDKSIRPYLTEEQIKQIDELQLMDSGLLLGCTDYNTRKMILENYYLKKYKGGE